MPDLAFTVESAEMAPFAAAPLLMFKLHIVDTAHAPTHHEIASITLQCQIQIEATKRRYGPAEQYGLEDLFGAPPRWGETLRTMLWTHTSAVAPPLPANAYWIWPYHAATTSMWLPPNIFTDSKTARFL